MDDLDFTSEYDRIEAAKRDRVCVCNHKLGEHEPTVIDGVNNFVGFEGCNRPSCDCDHFRLKHD